MTQAESPPITPPYRHFGRRLFQYRLRTLLIAITIIAAVLGVWSHKARQQRKAVAVFQRVGAYITYDPSLPLTRGLKEPPRWPQWLLDSSGVDYFAKVQGIKLNTRERIYLSCLSNIHLKVTDLNHLQGLTALRILNLDSMPVTDASLDNIVRLTSLRELDLSHTHVSDDGLGRLTSLTAMQDLRLDDTQVTDAGLKHLSRLTSLKYIFLANTVITDDGLDHLHGLTHLEALHLYNAQVTDAGVARLQKAVPKCQIFR